MRIQWVGVAAMAAGMAGCHSAFVDAVVENRTGGPVSVVEVDYPSASFGTETLAAGKDYRYRFQVQGSGPLKVLWTDSKQAEHTINGPALQEGAEGGLEIVLKPSAQVDWNLSLKK